MAEFEIIDEVKRPFKNKKLKPIMIAGVIIVVAVVLYQKGSTGNGQTTEYIGTYAGNTGATTEVSNMLEEYKTTVSGMLNDQQTSYSDQMGGYMEQLNAMFDAQMNAYDYQYQQKLEELESQLKQQGTGTVGGVNAGSQNSSGSAVTNNDVMQKPSSSSGSVGKGGAAIIPEWRESGSNAAEDNNGTGYITFGWVQHVHGDTEGTGSSFSDLSNRPEGKYYYENADGTVHDSAIKTIESTHSSKDYTSKYDGSTVSSGITETIITRDDGTRVVQYSPNKNR